MFISCNTDNRFFHSFIRDQILSPLDYFLCQNESCFLNPKSSAGFK